jgi:hypothetical protein
MTIPPSLNKMPGMSQAEVWEMTSREQLERIMRKLPLRNGAEDEIENCAWYLYDSWLLALVAVRKEKRFKHRLRTAGKRAKRAAQIKPGRPRVLVGDLVAVIAGNVYETLTGKLARRSICSDTDNAGKPYGPFHDFLTQVFQVLGIDSSPDARNMDLQKKLSRL